MIIKKSYLLIVLEVIFFLSLYLLVINPLRDFDIWFHLKSGEIFSKQGILFHDIFSYSAQGRRWYPYEWLYQVFIYHFKEIFGFEAIKYLTALLYSLISFFVFLIPKKLFRLNTFCCMLLTFIFMTSTFEFYTARPQSLAYLFFAINLFLILRYFFKDKNLLWITLPITLLWSNLHGSIFLDIALFGSFGVVSFINYHLTKQKDWLLRSKTLVIYSVLSFILSILPPLGFTQYELLWRFFQSRFIISNYISEWTPLTPDQLPFYIFSTELILLLIGLLTTLKKGSLWKESFWTLPLIGIGFSAYLANRNSFLSYVSLSVILGWILSKLEFKSLKGIKKVLLISITALFLIANIWIYSQKRAYSNSIRLYYPVSATVFIKNNLNGHMFNEYGYGGYLLYNLYPEKYVFVDGRTDVYLCCEMPDLLNLETKKLLSDSEYKKQLDNLWNKYDISYVLIRTEKNTILRKIGRILSSDTNWNLVFWDDFSEIFVKRDGKNDQVLRDLSTSAATPYEQNPFKPNSQSQALIEYQRMDGIVDSARSRNAIGFIYLQQGKYSEAKDQFTMAASLDPSFESPYMNLAELSAKDGDLSQAIGLYQKALELAPDRGLIYIRLGQLTLEKNGDLAKSKKIWQDGLNNIPSDDQSRKQLQILLQS